MVGKTKIAATLIAEMFSDKRIVIPETKNMLSMLDSADVAMERMVIFLDDIDRLIGAGGISDGALRRLVSKGNHVIATIRAAEYDRYRPADQLRSPEWDTLSAFERVFLRRDLTESELERLSLAVADPEIRSRVTQVGIGEYVGAAMHIAETLRLGPSVNPVGYALVVGAADWHRAGMDPPVPATALSDLAAQHLSAKDRVVLADDDIFDAGLKWATRDINPKVSLIQRELQDSFVVFEYALDILTVEQNPIPDANWSYLIERAKPAELIRIGFTARVTYHRADVAERAWRLAVESSNPDAFPRAAINLGALLRASGDLEGALAMYQRAIESGHADAAPMASINLGTLLLRDKGDVGGARAAYQLAINSGHVDAAPRGAFNLGVLLSEIGEVRGARVAYQFAIDSGHFDVSTDAAANLKVLESRRTNQRSAGHSCHKCHAYLRWCHDCAGYGKSGVLIGECSACGGTGLVCSEHGRHWTRATTR
ncbi:tetratricopeptide repeat protein [Kribbella sp. NPDC006257]|uniref:tetratricopeptide repeat protein n=1 Tax=Kribbella sp. NPDC006257 TaxID=3156738 RepID=UPI0033B41872